MKPFDLEKAKKGDPVITQGGDKVRILCFDSKIKNYPIIALVTNDSNDEECEEVETFTVTGKFNIFRSEICSHDLAMALKKVTRWVNLYLVDGKIQTGVDTWDCPKKAADMKQSHKEFIRTERMEFDL